MSGTAAIAGALQYAGGPYPWQIADANGFIGLALDANSTLLAASASIPNFTTPTTMPAGSAVGGINVANSDVYDFAISDPSGYLIYAVVDGVVLGASTGDSSGGSSTATYSAQEIADRNSRALALSAQVGAERNTTSARDYWNINHVIEYGQSLSVGNQGWPALPLSIYGSFDNLMMGLSLRPVSTSGTVWAPYGGSSAFTALATTCDDNGVQLTPSQVAALSVGDQTDGECTLGGAMNFWRVQMLQQRGLLADPTRRLLGSVCGVSGQSISQLSKGANPEDFNRLRQCASLAKAEAATLGLTYGVVALKMLQGEYDYNIGPSAFNGPVFQTLTEQFYADFLNDVVSVIAGQTQPPAIFTYQTSGAWTRDPVISPATNANGVWVGQAQLNSALTHPDWYLVARAYPVSDKGGHLDANGYRWLGNYFGKVMHRVITLGQKWLPLYPTQITYRDTSILVDFHVPFAPLVFDGPLVGNFNTSLVPVVYPNKGFAIFDDIGEVPIASVAIVSDTGVLITPTRALSTNPWLRYAGNETYAGNGNLRDSDPTTALDVYSYTAGSGQYPVEDILALVGNPYPLYNWCCAFNMPIVAG